MNENPPPLPDASRAHAIPPPLRKRKKASPLIAIVIVTAACLLVFAGYRILKVASMAVQNIQKKSVPREHVVDAPVYETLLGEGLSGSGFHFKTGDSVYLCMSLHQFDGRMPDEMGSFDFDEPIKVSGLVHKQNDIQVLSFQSDELRKIEPLSYSKDTRVDTGLPVYIHVDTGTVKGHVSSIRRATGMIHIRTAEPFAAAGQSGSPIVSGETGTVIAVLIGANSPEHATRVEAELLRFPETPE